MLGKGDARVALGHLLDALDESDRATLDLATAALALAVTPDDEERRQAAVDACTRAREARGELRHRRMVLDGLRRLYSPL